MDNDEWVLFKENRTKTKIRASISDSGAISFTKGTAAKFGINKNHHGFARLYYNQKAGKIGFSFADTSGDYTVKTNFRKDTGFWFSAKAFLDCFNIRPKKTTLYEDITWDATKNLLVINLDSAHQKDLNNEDFSEHEKEEQYML